MTNKTVNHILLIWNMIPETLYYYLVPVDHELAALVLKSKDGFVNSMKTDENHPVYDLNNALEKVYYGDKSAFPFDAIDNSSSIPNDVTITEIVIAGYLG